MPFYFVNIDSLFLSGVHTKTNNEIKRPKKRDKKKEKEIVSVQKKNVLVILRSIN